MGIGCPNMSTARQRVGERASFVDRLRAAKEASGIGVAAIATAGRLPVADVRGYLDGSKSPTLESCRKLADALNVPSIYLTRSWGNVELVSHRKHSKVTKRRERRTAIDVQVAFGNYYNIEDILDVQPEGFVSGYKTHELPSSDDEVEDLARDMRSKVGISPGEFQPDVHAVLDTRIRLLPFSTPVDVPQDRLDGCVVESDRGDKAIAFNTSLPIDRQRFTLAHELGHLILDDANDEKVANSFAAAFLMPADLVKLSFTSHTLDALLQLKVKFGCSIAALNTRCNALGLIDQQDYKRNWILLGYRGWRKREPDVGLPEPHYGRFADLCFDGWRQGLITMSKLSEFLGDDVSVDDFRGLM